MCVCNCSVCPNPVEGDLVCVHGKQHIWLRYADFAQNVWLAPDVVPYYGRHVLVIPSVLCLIGALQMAVLETTV